MKRYKVEEMEMNDMGGGPPERGYTLIPGKRGLINAGLTGELSTHNPPIINRGQELRHIEHETAKNV